MCEGPNELQVMRILLDNDCLIFGEDDLLKRKEVQWVMVGGKYRISKISFDTWLDGGPVPSPQQL